MAEIINQIPGFEKGRVQRISATDEVSESFIVAQMAADLRKKWNTSVLCISLDGHKEAIESLIPQENAVGRVAPAAVALHGADGACGVGADDGGWSRHRQ